MKKMYFILSLVALAVACQKFNFRLSTGANNAEAPPLSTISYSSCCYQLSAMPIYSKVAARAAQLHINMGDNIYGDFLAIAPGTASYIQAQYNTLKNNADFKKLKAAVPMIATWDDHDYGFNDAGASGSPYRNDARRLFCDFWGEPATSLRRTRTDGIYTSYYYGDDAHKVQIILLDNRWNRSNYNSGNTLTGYTISNDPNKTMLGATQWNWLKAELMQPAKIRFIVSGVQFCAEKSTNEGWSLFPLEQEKMYQTIRDAHAEGVIFLTGDVHYSDINKRTPANLYPIYDFTSSSINETEGSPKASAYRIAGPFGKPNYSVLNINWNATPVTITSTTYDASDVVKIQKTISLDELKFAL
ncbi:MAG: alkaline phosphatase D family protein [Chitinophagales bacterium]